MAHNVGSKRMSDNFRPGDTVYLKSGGPPMTVTKVDDDFAIDGTTVSCSWFDGRKLANGAFPPVALMIERPDIAA